MAESGTDTPHIEATPHSGARPVANTLALSCEAAGEAIVGTGGDLRDALQRAGRDGLPVMPLGAGSNVVLPPHLRALVLRPADSTVRALAEGDEHVDVRAGGACDWHHFVDLSLAQGWNGLENLALIPGTVGAAPVQNIGAYGRELEQFVVAVHGFALDTGEELCLSREECAFRYRDSVFKHVLRDRFLITAVDFRLRREAQIDVTYPTLAKHMEEGTYAETPRGVFEAVVDLRRRRLPDPGVDPNVGSFFKNPVLEPGRIAEFVRAHPDAPVHRLGDGRGKVSAAWLIEALGLRGHRLGPATVSRRHALVLENGGGAQQEDILALAALVRDRVRAGFGVELQPEPRIYSSRGEEQPLP